MIRTRALHASSNSGSCAETCTEQLLLILLLVLHCCDGSGMGLRAQSVLLLDEGTPLPKSLGLHRACADRISLKWWQCQPGTHCPLPSTAGKHVGVSRRGRFSPMKLTCAPTLNPSVAVASRVLYRCSLGLPVILFSAPLDAVPAILWSVFRCASPPYSLQPWTSPKQQHPSGHSARPSIPSWARRGCQSHWHLAQGQSVRLRQS
jgi:hypothetical protein